MEKNPREEALEFLKMHRTGVIATLSPQKTPRARLVYYAADDQFRVYFITLKNTRKAADLAADAHAGFVVAVEDVPQTVQIEGIVADITETATIDPVLVQLTDNFLSNKAYGAPINRIDQDKLLYFRLTPTWVRFGDFTEGYSSDEVFSEIEPA